MLFRSRTAAQALAQQRRDHEPGGLHHFARRRAEALAAALPFEQEDCTMRKGDFWDSKYWKGEDVEEPVLLTIKAVTRETLKNGGREDVKPVAYFKESKKGLVLNLTNWDSIATFTGEEDSDNWAGRQIELVQGYVEMQGETRKCVRVRRPAEMGTAKKAAKTQPPLKDEMKDEIGF